MPESSGLRQGDALLIIDVQADFLPGGSLAVPNGDAVLAPLNHWIARFSAAGRPIFATQDWHPADHCSFREQQGPWPAHCVAGTPGARIADALSLPADAIRVAKATQRDADAYSGFYGTDLDRHLRQFEFFVRKMPAGRNFLVACGLEQVLDFLESLRFSEDELDWLTGSGRFSAPFVCSLAGLRFTGDVQAMPEGTVFFADEPILRVVAPLREAQLVESRIINLLHLQTLVASKAARVRFAARDSLLVDFGLRRAHGAEAALLSARASFVAGFDGSSDMLAGMRWGIPLFGTMAHSFIEVHEGEVAAFEHFARSHPKATTLLIDTYDTEAAARALLPLVQSLAAEGIAVQAVRLDSGDLGEHARRVRAILDAGAASAVRIFASGNLDEYEVSRLIAAGAPIDGFGVGTRMNTSADAPYLDCAYKLQEYAGIARRKRSADKATWPGRKQVLRRYDEAGG